VVERALQATDGASTSPPQVSGPISTDSLLWAGDLYGGRGLGRGGTLLTSLRLSVLMDLCIHSLYVLVSKILFSIFINLYIHHLFILSTMKLTYHFI
jgi:hypothetical protein